MKKVGFIIKTSNSLGILIGGNLKSGLDLSYGAIPKNWLFVICCLIHIISIL